MNSVNHCAQIFALKEPPESPEQGCKSSDRAGPVMLNFISIRIFERFLKKIWTLLLTHFKLSIILSKKWRILAKSSRNIGKKRPGPARPAEFWSLNGPARPSWNSGPTGPARPSPLKFAGRNGPARPDLSTQRFTTLLGTTRSKDILRVPIKPFKLAWRELAFKLAFSHDSALPWNRQLAHRRILLKKTKKNDYCKPE